MTNDEKNVTELEHDDGRDAVWRGTGPQRADDASPRPIICGVGIVGRDIVGGKVFHADSSACDSDAVAIDHNPGIRFDETTFGADGATVDSFKE
jgi:hypothetical protein